MFKNNSEKNNMNRQLNKKPIIIDDNTEKYIKFQLNRKPIKINSVNLENISSKRKFALPLMIAILSFFIVVGTNVSYAMYKANVDVDGNYSFQVGTLDFEIQNESNSIKLLNAYPMSDTEGLSLTPYKFSIKNTGTMDANYVISLQDDEALKDACNNCDFLEKDRLKIELRENDVTILGPVLLSEIDKLKIGNLKAGAINNYELRLWLDYNNTTTLDMGKYYYGRINVVLYQETLESGSTINITDARDTEINSITITGNQVDGKNLGSDGSFDLVVQGQSDEARYTIYLKDVFNNTIAGIGNEDVLKLKNSKYVIFKSDGSYIELSDDTQNVLKSIRTFEGVNNIFIDGDILPSNIEISY